MTIKTLSDLLASRGHRTTILEQVRLWLAQTEVQELLAAAWDAALPIKHFDHGVVTQSYEDPDTGEVVTYESRDYAVECNVRGVMYGVGLATSPGVAELPEHAWLMAELALRDRLVDAALVGLR